MTKSYQTPSNTLSPAEVSRFRDIEKLGSVILLMLRLGRPTGPTEISEILGIHEQTCKKRLNQLKHLGHVTRTHHHIGWHLTVSGLQLTMPVFLNDGKTQIESIDRDDPLLPEENQTAIISQLDPPTTTTSIKDLESGYFKSVKSFKRSVVVEGKRTVKISPLQKMIHDLSFYEYRHFSWLRQLGVGRQTALDFAHEQHRDQYTKAMIARMIKDKTDLRLFVRQLKDADQLGDRAEHYYAPLFDDLMASLWDPMIDTTRKDNPQNLIPRIRTIDDDDSPNY